MSEEKKARPMDLIENPEPGWTTRRIESHRTVDNPLEWHVELIRERDGATVNFHHESLHVAFLRAMEHAHMSDNQLDQTPEQSLS